MRFRIRHAAPLILLASVISCSHEPIQEITRAPASVGKLDVSDVSFLIPPNKQNSIHISEEGPHGPILSKAFFGQFPVFSDKGHPGFKDLYEHLVITGFRFDPCGPPLMPEDLDLTQCILPNIRLIAQAVDDTGKPTTAALHMVFTLGVKYNAAGLPVGVDPDVRVAVFKELYALKSEMEAAGITTNGKPLGVHPALIGLTYASTARKDFYDSLRKLFNEYAHKDNYFVTAVMAQINPATPNLDPPLAKEKTRWEWVQGRVHRDDKTALGIQIVPISGAVDTPTSQFFEANTGSRDGALLSKPSSVVVEGAKISALVKMMKTKPGLNNQAGVDAGKIMENPRRIPVQQGDCVSCHAATTTMNYAFAVHDGWTYELSKMFLFDTRKAGITYQLDTDVAKRMEGPSYQVMSFAYQNGEPSISMRTLNETVEVVNMCNKKFYPLVEDKTAKPQPQQQPQQKQPMSNEAIKPPRPPDEGF